MLVFSNDDFVVYQNPNGSYTVKYRGGDYLSPFDGPGYKELCLCLACELGMGDELHNLPNYPQDNEAWEWRHFATDLLFDVLWSRKYA